LAEENAKSQNQVAGKANSESDSKVLTGDSLPPVPTSMPAAITTPQSNSGVSSALENQKLGRYLLNQAKKKCFFFSLSCLMWLKLNNKFKLLFLVVLFVSVILVFSTIFCLVLFFVVTCFSEK
jgi:hypothetical protein